MMTLNDVKKALYKEKHTVANFNYIRKGVAYYDAELLDGMQVRFEIPVSDMGDADFGIAMEAKLLNRWICL